MENREEPRIYIIGAGFAGQSIAREIKARGILGRVVAFLDDNPAKIGIRLENIPVLGPIRDVVDLLRRTPAAEAIIAMPSATRDYLAELYRILKTAGFARIRILPGIAQIVEGDAHLIQTREIDPQDLLGRGPIVIGLKESLSYLRNKRVLVTGAGGSIGSELARQLLSAGVHRLYLFGHGENSIYQIDRELRLLQSGGVGEKTDLVPVLGELKDRSYVEHILKRLKADVIFHTAAYKHVPMMEENPVAAVENNVFGTWNLVEGAKASGVQRFVLVSTDKAVDPVCMYGASKMLSERIVRGAHENSGTRQRFMVVRFGNVLGSRGSILPLFQRQIETGGPVTVTDPEASRYFMTIPEACSLVLKTGGVGGGGESYLLDMGEPIKIKDLAEQLIRFYGFMPERDIPIRYIGLRHGERLEEALHSSKETLEPTAFPRINRLSLSKDAELPVETILAEILPFCVPEKGRETAYRNRRGLREALHRFIPTLEMPQNEPEY